MEIIAIYLLPPTLSRKKKRKSLKCTKNPKFAPEKYLPLRERKHFGTNDVNGEQVSDGRECVSFVKHPCKVRMRRRALRGFLSPERNFNAENLGGETE